MALNQTVAWPPFLPRPPPWAPSGRASRQRPGGEPALLAPTTPLPSAHTHLGPSRRETLACPPSWSRALFQLPQPSPSKYSVSLLRPDMGFTGRVPPCGIRSPETKEQRLPWEKSGLSLTPQHGSVSAGQSCPPGRRSPRDVATAISKRWRGTGWGGGGSHIWGHPPAALDAQEDQARPPGSLGECSRLQKSAACLCNDVEVAQELEWWG